MSKLSLGVEKAVALRPDAVLAQVPSIVIPMTPDELATSMNALGTGVMLAGWATAATVYAWTKPQQGKRTSDSSVGSYTIDGLAGLGLRGLSSHVTVRAYRAAWGRAIEQGWAKPVKPGAVVTLPTQDFTTVWRPGVVMSSESPEWYTPPHVIEAVVATLGSIDLDPCADPERSVPATHHFTKMENGLAQPWHGRVYMNPPYGKTIGDWTAKLAEEYHDGRVAAAVALVPARTETDWWDAIGAEWICLIHGRLSFSGYETSAPFPSATLYLGLNSLAFLSAFKSLGSVYRRQ